MRSIRWMAVLAVTAAVLTVGAASALAAFQTGTYKGRTSQQRGVVMVVVPGKVKAFHYGFISRCASRATFSRGAFSNGIPIRRGTFHRSTVFSFTITKPGVGLLHARALFVISGRSSSPGKARGTLGLALTFTNSAGVRADACSTGKVFWRASK